MTLSSEVPAVAGLSPNPPAMPVYLEAWRIIRRSKWRIVLVLALGLAAGATYCFLSGPRYDSTTQLLVIKKRLDTTPITGPDQIRAADDYLATHMLLITSRRIIGRAIETGHLSDLKLFEDRGSLRQDLVGWASRFFLGAEPELSREARLTTQIIGSLAVTRDAQRPGVNPSNEVINLSFRGNVAADCPKVLEAIVSSYQDFLKDAYRNSNAETLELITQARDMVERDLAAKESAYQKFLAQTPPLWKTPDHSTAQQE